MDAALDSIRGFERNDPRRHCRIEIAETIDEVMMLVRDYILLDVRCRRGPTPRRPGVLQSAGRPWMKIRSHRQKPMVPPGTRGP